MADAAGASPPGPPSVRRLAARALAAALGAGLLGLVVVAAQVDDWSRDLTTNHAATSPDAADERLRPLDEVHLPPEALAARVREVAVDGLGWRLEGQEVSEVEATLRFVRTSRLLRLEDEVTVRLRPSPRRGLLLEAESRAPAWGGDLGRSPRTLRELLDALRTALVADGAL